MQPEITEIPEALDAFLFTRNLFGRALTPDFYSSWYWLHFILPFCVIAAVVIVAVVRSGKRRCVSTLSWWPLCVGLMAFLIGLLKSIPDMLHHISYPPIALVDGRMYLFVLLRGIVVALAGVIAAMSIQLLGHVRTGNEPSADPQSG